MSRDEEDSRFAVLVEARIALRTLYIYRSLPSSLHRSGISQIIQLMKSRKIYTKLLLAGSLVLMSAGLSSCEDFLTVLPTNQLPEESFWQDKADLEGVRAGAYDQLCNSGVTNRIIYWGELRSDDFEQNDMKQTDITYVMDGVLQPSNGYFDWASFYTGINYCNLILEQGDKMTEPGNEVDPGFTRSDWTPYKSEITALRALYYFYLVRAYRDVPFVTKSIRSDKEARSTMPSQTPGVAVLGELINELEETADKAPTNYGLDKDNKGRFTKRGAHALLADMYLWRGCMLKHFMDKTNHGIVNITDVAETAEGSDEVTYKTANGTVINSSYTNSLADECFKKAIEHADYVINDMKAEYDKNLKNSLSATEEQKTQPFPLILRGETFGSSIIDDDVYYRIFGIGNSSESIFEMQYDGSTTRNPCYPTFYSALDNGVLKAKYLAIANPLIANATSVDPTMGFGKTDWRLIESCNYASTESRKPITKFAASSVTGRSNEDLTKDESGSTSGTSSYSYRSIRTDHVPVYRLADVMLIKAEAIARTTDVSADDLEKGYQLVNQIFKRNNPGLVGYDDPKAASAKDEYKSYRVDDVSTSSTTEYVKTYKQTFTAANLLSLVYRERQREFFGEGKRWFDITRQVEASNDPKAVMTDFITMKNSVKSRLSQLYAFYNPIYSEEIKVNGADNGGNLVQNPVWDRYTKK